ncbi:hypothetical protein EJ110_NYTH03911 [Nymphaea thermarum]|nr:hypothetical protein EJ110_NYTH03911 [Nymphaea thermarum]
MSTNYYDDDDNNKQLVCATKLSNNFHLFYIGNIYYVLAKFIHMFVSIWIWIDPSLTDLGLCLTVPRALYLEWGVCYTSSTCRFAYETASKLAHQAGPPPGTQHGPGPRLFAIAFVLDPRFKLSYLKYLLDDLDKSDAIVKYEDIENILNELYVEYKNMYGDRDTTRPGLPGPDINCEWAGRVLG